MSYPPQSGYDYPPSSTGYPQQQAPYGGQQPYGQPPAQPGLGFDGLNNLAGPPAGGMPMPGAAPGYGGSPYPQPSGPGGYPAAGPGYGNNQSSFGGMAYAASAAMNFRPPQQNPYPQQQNPYQQQQNPYQQQQNPYQQQQNPYPQQQPPPPNRPPPPQQPTNYPSTQTAGQPAPYSSTTQNSAAQNIPTEPSTQGTVKDQSPFNPQQDAEILRKAMKGFGTDEKAVTHIIASRSNAQRQKIKLEFATMYGKVLIKELKSELSGNFEDAVLALLMPPDEFDAYHLNMAMEGLGTDEKALIEILCSRTNQEIKAASDAYKKIYKKDLEKELKSETSGHFKRLLVSLVQGSRLEKEPLNHQKAQEDARALYQAGEARWGTDESRFNVILSLRSNAQLRLIFDQYRQFSKRTMEKAIISEMSGDLKDGMLAVVKCANDRPAFFAEKMYHSMKGLGTDDKTLVRIMVSRSQVDMVQIKTAFKNMYGKTLASFITDDCSGDYKRILIQICGGHN